jgi:peroxiredoxin
LSRRLLAVIGLMVVAGAFYLARQRIAGSGGAVLQKTSTVSLAPEFSLPTLTGETLDLATYKGKVIFLDFWATWCDHCREQIPGFVELQSKYGDWGLRIIGISMDDEAEPVRDFCRQFKLNYPVVMGNAKTGELYGGVLGLPIAFLIGRDGRIYKKHIGATDILVLESEIVRLLKE